MRSICELVLSAFLLYTFVLPADSIASSSCLKVTSIAGESCENLAFTFDVSACQNRAPISQKPKVTCQDNKASVQLKTANFSYRFVAANESSWGKSAWKVQGDIDETDLRATKSVVASESSTPRSTASGKSKEELSLITKVGGFIDAQFNSTNARSTTQAFAINDGAVYLSAKFGNTTAFVDIPFAGASTSTTQNAGFNLGLVDAQAYVEHVYDFGFAWKLGQWDALYGFEVNDTIFNAATRQGLVFNTANPFVETGLLLTHNFGLLTWKAYVGNPNDTNGLFSTLKHIEYGTQLVLNHEKFRFAPGLRMRKTATSRLTHIQGLAGATLGVFAMDFEFDAIRNNSTWGYAFMPIVVANLDQVVQGLTGLVRFEYLKDLEGTPTNKRTIQLTVGPQYQVSKFLKLKTDYSWIQRKLDSTTASANSHVFNVAAVVMLGEI